MIEGLRIETLGKTPELIGTLVYPKKKKLKQVLETLSYFRAYIILHDGSKHKAKLKARWIERRYGKFRVFADTKGYKNIKEVVMEID